MHACCPVVIRTACGCVPWGTVEPGSAEAAGTTASVTAAPVSAPDNNSLLTFEFSLSW
nr:hypothetical protein GCM10017745_47780 [Saccharothrix mutabilis subsp. capreolus]